VEIHFLDRLRDEIKFPSVEVLREQIGRDVGRAQKYFRRLGSPLVDKLFLGGLYSDDRLQ